MSLEPNERQEELVRAESAGELFQRMQRDVLSRATPISSHDFEPPAAPLAPVLIAAIGEAIGNLYIAYKVGNQVDNIASGIKDVLESVAEVAKSLARVLDTLNEVIAEIKRILAAVHRDVVEQFMRQHMSHMQSSTDQIRTTVNQLKILNPSDAGTNRLLQSLRDLNGRLYDGILAYVQQEGYVPSLASLIACSPSIAMYTQTYTLLLRYDVPDSTKRISPWDTAEHQRFVALFGALFDDMATNRQKMTTELSSTLRTPTSGRALFYDRTNFVDRKLPFQYGYDREFYGNLPEGHFAYVPGSLKGLSATIPNATGWGWLPIKSGNSYNYFPNIDFVKAGYEANLAKATTAAQYREYLARTQDADTYRTKVETALKKPTVGW